MDKHLAKYHDPDNPHPCPRCGCRFADPQAVDNHRRQCGGTNEATWKAGALAILCISRKFSPPDFYGTLLSLGQLFVKKILLIAY